MDINEFIASLDFQALLAIPPIVVGLFTLIYKFIETYNTNDLEIRKDKKVFKTLLRNSFHFILIFSSFFLVLFFSSVQFIQQNPAEWAEVENHDEIMLLTLTLYSLISLFIALYFLVIDSNFKTEIYLVLKNKSNTRKYIIVSKSNEQNITTIQYKDPENFNTIYEKAFDLKENKLTFKSETTNALKESFLSGKDRAPHWFRLMIMSLFGLFIIVLIYFLIDILAFHHEFQSLINEFSLPIFWIFLIISLITIIPLLVLTLIFKMTFDSRWHKK